jgi:uncharacterized protein
MDTVDSPGSDNKLSSKARGILRTLQGRSDCVRSSALVSYDGLMLACVLAEGVSGDRFGAMCASLLALSTRAAKEVDRGDLRQIILDGEFGPMLLTRAGKAGVLAIAANPTPSLGKLILDARNTAAALSELYTGTSQ